MRSRSVTRTGSARRSSYVGALVAALLLGGAACSDQSADPAAAIQQGTLLSLANGTTRQDTAAEGAATAERVSAVVGCAGAADPLACLCAVSVAALLDNGVGMSTTVDGDFLPLALWFPNRSSPGERRNLCWAFAVR